MAFIIVLGIPQRILCALKLANNNELCDKLGVKVISSKSSCNLADGEEYCDAIVNVSSNVVMLTRTVGLKLPTFICFRLASLIIMKLFLKLEE